MTNSVIDPLIWIHPAARLSAQTPASDNIFFGFHDLTPWSESGDRLLCMRLDPDWHELRDCTQTGRICEWHPGSSTLKVLAETNCWNFQQAARQQWLPDGSGRFVYNRLDSSGACAAAVHDPDDGSERELVGGVYTIAPDGSWAITPDFGELTRHWPAYGISGA